MSKISPQAVLALTATAGPPVINDICSTLGICNEAKDQEKGVAVFDCNRDNIDVAVNFVGNAEERLNMVRQDLLRKCDATIFNNLTETL